MWNGCIKCLPSVKVSDFVDRVVVFYVWKLLWEIIEKTLWLELLGLQVGVFKQFSTQFATLCLEYYYSRVLQCIELPFSKVVFEFRESFI